MPVFAVLYSYTSDSEAVRNQHRAEHRQFLDDLSGTSSLLASGPWAEGEPGALLVFSATDQATLEVALDTDPFKTVGVIAARTVRQWTQARGPWVD